MMIRRKSAAWQLSLAIEIRPASIAGFVLQTVSVFHKGHQMHSGELLTRSTVWVALTLYVASELPRVLDQERITVSSWLKTVGCVFFLGHIAFAFNYFYDWSHATAYAETARQSKELTGWDSGAGLYFNYIFALVWVTEVAWFRIAPLGYLWRPAFWRWAIRGLFLFMIFNGAYVFVRGKMRWFGLVLCLSLLVAWWLEIKRKIDCRPRPKSC